MKVPIITQPQPNNPTFGIFKSHRQTSYGEYMTGNYKGYKIEIFNAYKNQQKLIYVSDYLLNWVKSKLIYFENGVKKAVRSERKCGIKY